MSFIPIPARAYAGYNKNNNKSNQLQVGYRKEKKKRELNTPKKKTGRPAGNRWNTATIHSRLSPRTQDGIEQVRSPNETSDETIYRAIKELLLKQGKNQTVDNTTNTYKGIDSFTQESKEMEECMEKYPVVIEKMNNLQAIIKQYADENVRLQEKISSLMTPSPSPNIDVNTNLDMNVKTTSIAIDTDTTPIVEESEEGIPVETDAEVITEEGNSNVDEIPTDSSDEPDIEEEE